MKNIIGLYDLVNLKEPNQIAHKTTYLQIFKDVKQGTYKSQCLAIRECAKVYDALIANKFDEELKALSKTQEYIDAKKALSIAKNKLKCFTISGIFRDNERGLQGLITETFTQIMQVDIDWKENQFVDMQELRNQLITLPYVLSVFTSPSGNGLKCFVKHDQPHENHEKAFLYIEKIFADNFDVVIDKQCKDISRVCFVSYDENIYVNENATSLTIDLEAVKVVENQNLLPRVTITYEKAKDVFEHCVNLVNRKRSFVPGNKSNYRFVLACFLNEYGVTKDQAENFIKSNFPNSTNAKAIDINTAYKKVDKHASKIFSLTIKEMKAQEKANWEIRQIAKKAKQGGRTIDSVIELAKLSPITANLHPNKIKEVAKEVFNEKKLDDRLELLKTYLFEGELGMAKYVQYCYTNKFIYDKTSKEWRMYEKGVWRLCHKFEFENIVFGDIIEDLKTVLDLSSDESVLKMAHKRLNDFHTRKYQNNVNVLASQKLSIRKDDLDTHKHLLCLDNYTLNFSDKKITLQEHNPLNYLSITNGIVYDDKATCPTFDKFIEETFLGDREMIEFMQQIFGLCLTGFTVKQIFYFYGEGGNNGKSKLLNALSTLLGEYYLKVAESKFVKSYFEDSEKKFAGLEGKRAIISGEMNEDAILDDSVLKNFTGEEVVSSRNLYEKAFTFMPQGKIIMYGNYRPTVKGKDDAFYNRFFLIPFLNKVPKEKQNLNLDNEIKAEISGVLNWALRGLQSYFANGLVVPKLVINATKEYKESQVNELSQDAQLILDKIKPCNYKDENGVINPNAVLMTATEIINKFADLKQSMSRHFLGREMIKLGFVAKSYGANVRGNAKLYCVEIINQE